MTEKRVSTNDFSLDNLIGKEVTIKHVKGKIPLVKGMFGRYKEFILDVQAMIEKDDYKLVILMRGKRKDSKVEYTGYKRLLSEVNLILVADGETVDIHTPEIQRMHEELNKTYLLLKNHGKLRQSSSTNI
ncbi:hypothetical protein SAMN04487970_101692 [Paenibacillus tianmuensis]|uniref:Uncharacterized protein n=1 Tax=Paenibacillus tianmuensis TaxID=624147 RepID=A0A1G4RLI2_9BACL|nr:hypothetical protein [Paenibacillus tianmuensis]SCW57375.1 hypothetical protein SAMN04487970_101692 [Paenibacillus tianmuensis]